MYVLSGLINLRARDLFGDYSALCYHCMYRTAKFYSFFLSMLFSGLCLWYQNRYNNVLFRKNTCQKQNPIKTERYKGSLDKCRQNHSMSSACHLLATSRALRNGAWTNCSHLCFYCKMYPILLNQVTDCILPMNWYYFCAFCLHKSPIFVRTDWILHIFAALQKGLS